MTPEGAAAYIKARSQDDPSGCRLWSRSTTSAGYGNAWMGKAGGVVTAHRLAVYAATGTMPARGLEVRHTCNVPRCVNPAHLVVGTHAENMADVARGRYHARRKLTTEAVHAIRASVESLRTLAARYGVSRTTIACVRSGRFYKFD